MKKIFYILFAAAFCISCSEKETKVTVTNPSDFDRSSELAEVSLDELKSKIQLKEGQVFVVKNAKGEIIPSQQTYDNKLIFQSGVTANASETFSISGGEKVEFEPKTYGRLISERYDDFAWENDRVGFRIYGAALMAIDGPSNGIDLWYKRTPNLIIDKWYKDDLAKVASYHKDSGEGLDDYKVGRALGAGAMAPYVDGKLVLNENFIANEVLENGPLRTTVHFTYKDIEANGKTFSEGRTISIDAGSQLAKVVQEYGIADTLTVAAGIAKREGGDAVISDPNKGYVIYTEPNPNNGDVYIGLVFPEGLKDVKTDSYDVVTEKDGKKVTSNYQHTLAIADYHQGTPLTYYTGYGWTRYGFATDADFQKYIENFAAAQKQPLNITVN